MSDDDLSIKTSDYRLVRLSLSAFGDTHENFYAIPDDGRDLEDITLGELKAAPAVTGQLMFGHFMDGRQDMRDEADRMLSEIQSKT